MNDILVSGRFAASADSLPKESRAKLSKLLKLLSSDPRNPGLHLKKMKAARANIYEVRFNRSLRAILEFRDGVIRLLDVGAHDEALRFGERVEERAAPYGVCREEAAPYGTQAHVRGDDLEMYLAGDDCALSFVAPPASWLDESV